MNALPACCTPLLDHWPLPRPLAGVRLISTRFDPALLTADDFTLTGIPRPRGVDKRQAEFLAGRLCAHAALHQLTGTGTVPAVGEDRAPQWPGGISGSITHSHGWAAAVVARHADWRGLGLDMERLLGAERANRLAGEILTPAELRRLAQQSAERQARLVTLTFSLKESLFKALYPLVHKRFYFEHAELLECSDDGSARLRLLIDLSPEWHSGRELEGQFSLFDGSLLSLVAVPSNQGE
ncbi:4'-phosphopantetheinyl transferase family protein [Zestomonas carbonaria]|uniref:Enterobactin synthase component D n=1 Tax=Zestomonas carbonaria TaxID=2762745 RepID=A0A7U7EQL3_9GAMM|nr:4'-phosphopantetheinyl transferase [Pseudomonas carbonaria]CAD5109339.1 hypothetical protein PSEWESI4_03636 [Pseudomonas carbonaria]